MLLKFEDVYVFERGLLLLQELGPGGSDRCKEIIICNREITAMTQERTMTRDATLLLPQRRADTSLMLLCHLVSQLPAHLAFIHHQTRVIISIGSRT